MKDGSRKPLLRESGVRKSTTSMTAFTRLPGSCVRRGGSSQKVHCGEDNPVHHQKLGCIVSSTVQMVTNESRELALTIDKEQENRQCCPHCTPGEQKIKESGDFLSVMQETVGAGNCPQSAGSPTLGTAGLK